MKHTKWSGVCISGNQTAQHQCQPISTHFQQVRKAHVALLKLSYINLCFVEPGAELNRQCFWFLCTDKALADYRSANNRRLTIKKTILLSYLSYLFRLRLLSEDSYLLEWLQTADKAKKTHTKQSYDTHPLLPETEANLMFAYFWFSHFSRQSRVQN